MDLRRMDDSTGRLLYICKMLMQGKKMDVTWDLWEHHNGILHEAENVVTGAELRRLDRNVPEVYMKLQQLQLTDWHLLLIYLSWLLKKDKVYKETWLSNALAVVKRWCTAQWHKRHARHRLTRGMQWSMHQYLHARPS